MPLPVRGGVSAATLQTFLDKAVAALESGHADRLNRGESGDGISIVVGMASFETAASGSR